MVRISTINIIILNQKTRSGYNFLLLFRKPPKTSISTAIRDVAGVLKLHLPEADRLAKLVPDAPKMNFTKAFMESPELKKKKTRMFPL